MFLRAPMFLPALILAGCSAQAGSAPPAAICGQGHVLEAVQQRLSRAGQPVMIEEASAGQVPGESGDVVFCAVRVHVAIYDTNRQGPLPADVVQTFRYALELRRNGVFLRP